MIDQITVFLENKRGHLAALCRTMADANINMRALSIAETTDYGVVRIIADDTDRAVDALRAAGLVCRRTQVTAVELPNKPGALADLLELLDEHGYNVHYGYCFSIGDGKAIDVLKIHRAQEAAAIIQAAGYTLL
jgi:hypothetical protein